jgi:hypothetical protein
MARKGLGCCFDNDGGFMVGAVPDASVLEELFRLQVFSMLKKEGKINGTIMIIC